MLRRLGLAAVGIVIVAIVFLASVGIDLWTDIIWYQSVGFESVLWTRLGSQLGLFAVALVLALVVLLGNLWLAGRFVPPVDPDKPGVFRSWTDRITEAQRRAEHNARLGGTGPYGVGRQPSGPTFVFETDEIPNLVPVGTWVVALFAVLLALGVAGAVSGAWETLLLWVNRVPFSPTGSVTDPVFGRDVSFFLFELPFFRFVQSLASGLLLAALAVTGARYLLATTEGGEVFVTRVRVHVAVIAGLYLLTIAFGYQLDKYELVYSQAGVATGVAFADANARFMAYDVLTFLSGIAGALLIAGAFTRWLWPLGVVVGVWFAASLAPGPPVPGGHPALLRGPEHVRPGGAVHRQQHRDDAARASASTTGRAAPTAARRRSRGTRSSTRRTRSPTPGCGTTARSRRRWTRSRPCASTTTSTTSTRTATSSTATCAR